MKELDEIRNKAKAILGENFADQAVTERVLFRMVIALCDFIDLHLATETERVGHVKEAT